VQLPSLIDAVEFRRCQYGWSQNRMAQELGLTRGHYSEFISGKRGLPLQARCRAYALGVPADVLLQVELTPKEKAALRVEH
jgi:transcriptional regulator with XRE-family HTH domain